MPPAASQRRFPTSYRRIVGRVFALLFVIGISVYIFSIRDQVDTLTRYGYPGIFLFSLLTSATVILPAPGLIIVFAMGGVLNPVLVALFAGSGATLGELSGFLAGISGRMVVENTHTYDRIREWMTTHPRLIGWTILLLAFLPLPVFDMAGMAAGALRMPVSRFLAWCWVGKIFKMLVVAYLGAASLNLFGLFL